jgi:hypothetical protein
MSIRRARLFLGLIAAGACFQQQAYGAQLGPYVGGFYGTSEKQDDGENYSDFTLNYFYPELGFAPTTHIEDFDTQDQGYAALAGYRIHANLAIEGMFVTFGEVTYTAQSEGVVNLITSDGLQTLPLGIETVLRSRLSGLGLSALAIWPISYRWEVYARGGIQFSSIRTDATVERTSGTERIRGAEASIARESTLDLMAGAGVAVSIHDVYGARLEYLRVIDAGSDSVSRGDADMISLGIIVAF